MHRCRGGGGGGCLKLNTCMVGIRAGREGELGVGGRGNSAISRLICTDAGGGVGWG